MMKERKTKTGKWFATAIAVLLLCGLTVCVSSLAGGNTMTANGFVDEEKPGGEIETWALELRKIEPDSQAAQSEEVIENEAVPLEDLSFLGQYQEGRLAAYILVSEEIDYLQA